MKTRGLRGFTLLEVLASLAIFAIAVVVLIESQTRSMSNVQNVRAYEKAVFIAENQLHWTMIDLSEAESWEEYGQVSGEDLGCDWRVTITPVDSQAEVETSATLLKVIAEVSWPMSNRHQGYYSVETWYLWSEQP